MYKSLKFNLIQILLLRSTKTLFIIQPLKSGLIMGSFREMFKSLFQWILKKKEVLNFQTFLIFPKIGQKKVKEQSL